MTPPSGDPRQTCELCERFVTVEPSGRGFPPEVAALKLRRICGASGCACRPKYTAGLLSGGPIVGQETADSSPKE